MLSRFDAAPRLPPQWQGLMKEWHNLPLEKQAEKINEEINSYRYVEDLKNWRKEDYWETPAEFFTRGGDCEDFAIAKYTWLKTLGVPEEKLRLAIVHDKIKNNLHTVLVVETNRGPLILDNQEKIALPSTSVHRYQPIYSINREAWWAQTDRYRKEAPLLAAGGQ